MRSSSKRHAAASGRRRLAMVCWSVCVGMALLLSARRECCAQDNLPPPLEIAPPSDLGSTQDNDERDQRLLDCEPALHDAPLSMATVDISPRDLEGQLLFEADLPTDCNKYRDTPTMYSALEASAPAAPCLLRSWASAQFCHRPLYFEERALERCGVSHGVWQTPKSAVRFFGGTVLLPLKMWCLPPCTCVKTPACL